MPCHLYCTRKPTTGNLVIYVAIARFAPKLSPAPNAERITIQWSGVLINPWGPGVIFRCDKSPVPVPRAKIPSPNWNGNGGIDVGFWLTESARCKRGYLESGRGMRACWCWCFLIVSHVGTRTKLMHSRQMSCIIPAREQKNPGNGWPCSIALKIGCKHASLVAAGQFQTGKSPADLSVGFFREKKPVCMPCSQLIQSAEVPGRRRLNPKIA